MSEAKLFEGFTDEEQEQYALEAEQMYDPETVRESNRKWKSYSAAQKETILAEGHAIYRDMIAVMPKGADSPEAQAIVERWRQHLNYFWAPRLEQLHALASGYSGDPRFKANFDKMHPQLAEFLREAVKVYVSNQKE